ncbi:chitinase [Amycolatopsis sp. cg5]|uniref:chitinase n=1 Tax=Amycolatopsis sp. cg5 TaxID=3238802 RepID=UPI003523FDC5
MSVKRVLAVLATFFAVGTMVAAPLASASTSGEEAFVVNKDQFNKMFPNRNGFYTYEGLVAGMKSFGKFANEGNDDTKKREAAAFLANVNHESDGLKAVREYNTANYSHYCDPGAAGGCPAGRDQYYGRGPIQLSWNYNYKAAGDSFGVDLLKKPDLVATDAAISWKTGLWFWNTQSGAGSMKPHDAMVQNKGFGQTIRSINGALECDGKRKDQVEARVSAYRNFTKILGVDPGGNLYC